MKLKLILFICSFVFLLFSCEKKDSFCKEKEVYCTLSEAQEASTTDFQNPDNLPSNRTKYILEDLKQDAITGCIIAGYIKYLDDGETVALVDYGHGEGNEWAVITNCVNGDCDNALAYCTKFKQDCN